MNSNDENHEICALFKFLIMSQNKTRFPGMENMGGNPYNREAYNPNGENDRNQPRTRRNNEKATRFPGMEAVTEKQTQQTNDQHDPIVGFLFSVSKIFGRYIRHV